MSETTLQRVKREDAECQIYYRLLAHPRLYSEVSGKRIIELNNELFSLRWILYYAEARHAGIACMHTSAYYANERANLSSAQEPYGPYSETHYVGTRSLDGKLLYQAHLYLKEHGHYKTPTATAV